MALFFALLSKITNFNTYKHIARCNDDYVITIPLRDWQLSEPIPLLIFV